MTYSQNEDFVPLRCQCLVLRMCLKSLVNKFQDTVRIALASEICRFQIMRSQNWWQTHTHAALSYEEHSPCSIITLPPAGVRSIAISMSVCLSVCPHAYLTNHISKRHEIFCTCCLPVWGSGNHAHSRGPCRLPHPRGIAGPLRHCGARGSLPSLPPSRRPSL